MAEPVPPLAELDERLAGESDPVRQAAWLVLAACDEFLPAPHRHIIAPALNLLRKRLEATDG